MSGKSQLGVRKIVTNMIINMNEERMNVPLTKKLLHVKLFLASN